MKIKVLTSKPMRGNWELHGCFQTGIPGIASKATPELIGFLLTETFKRYSTGLKIPGSIIINTNL
jgi:hypothetical protein